MLRIGGSSKPLEPPGYESPGYGPTLHVQRTHLEFYEAAIYVCMKFIELLNCICCCESGC